jgi:hypothetical protein
MLILVIFPDERFCYKTMYIVLAGEVIAKLYCYTPVPVYISAHEYFAIFLVNGETPDSAK